MLAVWLTCMHNTPPPCFCKTVVDHAGSMHGAWIHADSALPACHDAHPALNLGDPQPAGVQ